MTESEGAVPAERIAATRRFNRFHTRLVGALGEHLHDSPYGLTHARVLYDIAHPETGSRTGAPPGSPTAADLGRLLGLDRGYLSRLIAGLETEGLITRTPAADNAKRLTLSLTDKGRAAVAQLERAASAEVAALLAPLSETDQRRLVASMRRIETLLGPAGAPPPPPAEILLRGPEPGDMARVVAAQAALYAREHGWDGTYEALAAEIVAAFIRDFTPDRERCWIADREGEMVGAVFVARQDDHTAKLRLLHVDASARGQGLGRRLVETAVTFARTAGYREMVLWTQSSLTAAGRLYRAAGFELEREEPHHAFGQDLTGQYWRRDL